MVRRMLMLVALMALTVTMGCSTTQKWMAGGAVAGGTVGGIWAANGGILNAGEGIAVGAVTGAAAGGLIGNIIEERDNDRKFKEMEEEIARLKAELQAKTDALAAANKRIAELEAQLKGMQRGAVVREFELTLTSDVLFQPGKALLSAAGKKALDEAAGKLKSQFSGKFIMIEGHTDADPIKASGWKSNWELGAARSLTVLHYLNDKGVDPAKLSAATFSKYQPVASNDNAAGKAKNRRAAIVVYKSWETSGK